MQIKMTPSKTMDDAANEIWGLEGRNIRIPAAIRAQYGLSIGNPVHLREVDGSLMVLRVSEARLADLMERPDCACVTTANFSKLFLTDTGDAELHRVIGLTLGCDPELFLIRKDTGHLIAAHRLFRKYGEVGHDGMLLEFRPQPSIDEAVVTANLHSCILKARAELNRAYDGQNIGMIAGSFYRGLAAGFHLHYGLPKGLLGHAASVRYVAKMMTLMMDYFVGIPAIIPEGNFDAGRRSKPNLEYGKPGGYRLDGRTLEYRLPGGILLRHPVLTQGILALGATVIEDVVSRISTWTDMFAGLHQIKNYGAIRSLYPSLPEMTDIFYTICSSEITQARAMLPRIVADVRSMNGYKKHAHSVEPFFQCLFDGTVFDNNIERNWGGVQNAQQQGQMGLL